MVCFSKLAGLLCTYGFPNEEGLEHIGVQHQQEKYSSL